MFVYLIGNKQHRVLKIGVSRRPQERLAELQKYNPYDLTVFATVAFADFDAAQDFEQTLHRCLESHRLRGEWFKLTGLVGELVVAAEKTPDPQHLLRVVDFSDAVEALEQNAV